MAGEGRRCLKASARMESLMKKASGEKGKAKRG